MWLVKKAASKVKQISSSVIKEESQAQKLVKAIVNSNDSLMSVKKMSELATKSFEMEHFEEILRFIIDKLNDLKLEKKSLKRRLNLLVLIAYLIKHGASGFIDQFRSNTEIFERYEVLLSTEETDNQKIKRTLIDLSERAAYIKTLLNDKAALRKEKEIAMMIREKLMAQSGDYSQHIRIEEGSAEQRQEKVQSFLEMYVWRYTDKLDKKLDKITDLIIDKIDAYLDGQIPQSFEIDEQPVNESQKSGLKQSSLNEKVIIKQNRFMKQKLLIEENLIDLAQRPKVQIPKVVDLLEIEKEVTEQLPVIKLDLQKSQY